MRDAKTDANVSLRIVDDLHGETLAAVAYGPNRCGFALLRLNRSVLSGHDVDRALLWARRQLAAGKRVSRLLADELDRLA